GEAKYADVLELALYNAVPAGVSLDGTRFFYTNTLRQLDRMPADLRWPRARQPFLSSFCCPPNVARIVAETATYAYGRSPVAVQRGPVVYCLESTDLPAGTSVQDVAVSAGVEWRPRHDAGLLGGVTMLEGRGVAAARPWGRELYRDYRPAAAPADLRLIPYS